MHTWEYTWEILINILESFLFLIFIEDKMKKSHRFTKNISIISLSPLKTISYSILCLIGFFFGQFIVTETLKSFTLFEDIAFSNELALVSSLYCFLFLLLLSYIYILNYTKEQNRKLLNEKQQLLLEEAEYKNLIDSTKSLRELKHDMKHHLSTVLFLEREKNTMN